jgi:hypothetical protein
MRGVGRVVYLDYFIGPERAVFFIKLVEHFGAVTLAVGETIENGDILAFREGPENGNDIFR